MWIAFFPSAPETRLLNKKSKFLEFVCLGFILARDASAASLFDENRVSDAVQCFKTISSLHSEKEQRSECLKGQTVVW